MLLENIKKESNLILIALGFFTRIPIMKELDFSQQNLNQASRYFSLVGWLIGFICALSFYLVSLLLPISISIIISMIAGLLLTGGFHEDGLADSCDGLGGGWTAEDKLRIMKDSRIGSYGSLALWSVLSLKFFLLLEIANANSLFAVSNIFIALLVSHPVSRSLSTSLIYVLTYVSDIKTAKARPLAESSRKIDLAINLAIGCSALLILSGVVWTILFSQLVLFFILKWFFYQQVKGFTGDLLGAAQQISEIVIYTLILGSLFTPVGVST